jgi:hypothetical protein
MKDDYTTMLNNHRNKRQRDTAEPELCKNGPCCKFHIRGFCRFKHETPAKIIICNLCKREGHTTLTCPEAVCHICKRKGHTSRNCSSQTSQFTVRSDNRYGPPPSMTFARYFQ